MNNKTQSVPVRKDSTAEKYNESVKYVAAITYSPINVGTEVA